MPSDFRDKRTINHFDVPLYADAPISSPALRRLLSSDSAVDLDILVPIRRQNAIIYQRAKHCEALVKSLHCLAFEFHDFTVENVKATTEQIEKLPSDKKADHIRKLNNYNPEYIPKCGDSVIN